jgi:predicted NBD/HSP70 family sugar kinase
MIVGTDGKLCAHGGDECLKRYVCMDTVIQSVKRKVFDCKAINPVTLESIGAVYDQCLCGAVRQVMDDAAEKLVQAISNVVCLTGIRRVAIGGGIERLGDGFLKTLRTISGAYCAGTPMRGVTIDYARSGPSGDTLGIAAYYLDKVFTIEI